MVRLNIRIEDLKRAKTGLDSKQIKARKELLALAMWFKVQHSNGAILRVTKAYLRKKRRHWQGQGRKTYSTNEE